MNELEEWKPIKNYEKNYQISNHGRVKSISRIKKSNWGNGDVLYVCKERFLLLDDSIGYSRVKLTINKMKKSFLVHRLVADHFLINNLKKQFVNHINGNKLDNKWSNLEWVTAQENTNHAYKNGLMGWKSKKLKKSDVIYIRKSNEKLITLSKMFNLSTRQIYAIKRKESFKNI